MQKRVISILLAFVLVFGMIPFGSATAQETAQTIYAVRASSLSLDNNLTEPEWTATAKASSDAGFGSIGAVWDSTNLYLGISTDAVKVTVAAGGKSVEALPVNGTAEFSVLGQHAPKGGFLLARKSPKEVLLTWQCPMTSRPLRNR